MCKSHGWQWKVQRRKARLEYKVHGIVEGKINLVWNKKE